MEPFDLIQGLSRWMLRGYGPIEAHFENFDLLNDLLHSG